MLSGRIRYTAGKFQSGHRRSIRLTPVFKPLNTLSFDASYEWNDVRLPEGDFITHVINARANINQPTTGSPPRWRSTTRRRDAVWSLQDSITFIGPATISTSS